MKDQVEKWGAEVVEETSQNTMRNRFVCVKICKLIAPSFVEMADTKKYFDDFVILNICELSTIGNLNYVGPAINATKLDTNIVGDRWNLASCCLPRTKNC